MKEIKQLIKKIDLNKIIENPVFPYLMIFVFSILLLLPNFSGKFHLGDDEYFHLGNIMTYAKELPMSIFAKILPDVGNNLGFGTGIFYPALPHIIGAIIYKFGGLFGIGIMATDFILNFLIFFLSGLTMYLLGKKVFDSSQKGLIASLFYITYNYVFVDVVMRGALNESFMFIFMPLVFLGIYYLFYLKNYKMFYICFITGYIGMMYSHLVMSVFFTIFLIIFLLFFIKNIFNKKNFLALCLASIFILIFTAPFYVPIIEHKILGDYVVFERVIFTLDDLWSMPIIGFFLPSYFATGNDGLIYSNLNFIMIVFFVVSLFWIFNKKNEDKNKRFLMAMIVFAILGIILNGTKSLWLHVPETLLSIQFLWRLSMFVGFGFAFVAAYSLDLYLNLFKKKYVGLALMIILAFLVSFVIQNNNKLVFHNINPSKNFGPTNAREYFPLETYKKYRDYFEGRNSDEIIVVKGEGEAKVIKNRAPYMKFKVSKVSDSMVVELPRIYYLGYKITDDNGVEITYKKNKRGFMSVAINKTGTYTVNYTGTVLDRWVTVLKYLVVTLVALYVFYKRKRTKEA